MCKYIYIYIFVCMCIYIYIHINVHVYMYTCIIYTYCDCDVEQCQISFTDHTCWRKNAILESLIFLGDMWRHAETESWNAEYATPRIVSPLRSVVRHLPEPALPEGKRLSGKRPLSLLLFGEEHDHWAHFSNPPRGGHLFNVLVDFLLPQNLWHAQHWRYTVFCQNLCDLKSLNKLRNKC